MWNPNPLPVFVLIVIYALWEVCRGNSRFILLLASAFMIAWQLHEQSLLLAPALALAWMIFRPRIRWTVLAGAIGLAILATAPLLIYELSHGFANTRALVDFAIGALRRGESSSEGRTRESQLTVLFEHLRGQAPLGPFATIGDLPRWLALLGVAALFWWSRRRVVQHGAVILLLRLATSVLYSFWPGALHSYYALILLPLPFLLIGLGVDVLRRIHPLVAVLVALTVGLLIYQQFGSASGGLHAATPSGGSLGAVKRVTDRIPATTNGRPYNFRLLTVSGSIGHDSSPYRYLLGLHDQPPTDRADLDTYLDYRPPEYADGASRQGIVIDGLKLVRQAPPRVGPNLLVNGGFAATTEKERAAWKQTSGSSPGIKVEQGAEGAALAILGPRGADPNYSMTVIQELPLSGGKQYLVRFRYRNEAAPEVQRVYLQTRGATEDYFPSGAGYIAQTTGEWTTGSFLVTAAPGTTAATIWLRVNGPGKAWFTEVEVREVLSGTVIP